MSKYSIGLDTNARKNMWNAMRSHDPDNDDEPVKRSLDNHLLRPVGWSDGRFLNFLNDEDCQHLYDKNTKIEFPEMTETDCHKILEHFFENHEKDERKSSPSITPRLGYESLFIIVKPGSVLFDKKFPGEEEFNMKISRLCLEYPFLMPQNSDETLSNLLCNYEVKSVLFSMYDTRKIMIELTQFNSQKKLQIYIYKCFRPYRYKEARNGIRNDIINSNNFLYNNAAHWLMNSMRFNRDGTIVLQKDDAISEEEFKEGLKRCMLSEEAFKGIYQELPVRDMFSKREIMTTLYEKPIPNNTYLCGNELLWLLGVDTNFGKWGLRKGEYGEVTLHKHKDPTMNMPWRIGYGELPAPEEPIK